MMQIKTRYVSKYVEIIIEDCGDKIDCGLLEDWEARNLAEHLREISDELGLMFNTEGINAAIH